MMGTAFYFAEKYQIPVIVLVDQALSARVDKKLLSFASNDGAGERPRRLRVRVPR